MVRMSTKSGKKGRRIGVTDYHLHTKYSHDSKADLEEYAVKAIEMGMDAICFTDHLDFNQRSPGYGNYSPEGFFEELAMIKKKYGDKLVICAGAEVGEPHVYGKELSEIYQYPYDFILGSMHWYGDLYFGKDLAEKYSIKEFYSIYWGEILKAVKQGGIDALAHIDLPKRFFQDIYYEEKVLKEIFKCMIEKEIALEINTSFVRKGIGKKLLPGEMLEIYRDCGGKYITIGSDAHQVQDLGTAYQQARSLAQKYDLQEVIFKERIKKPILI